ncbi:MAG: LysR family transcriptional regulator [Epsilonproteobacteria bacterium]|nr:LysR family transcriptional regulator [Campylobacterota bacterium]
MFTLKELDFFIYLSENTNVSKAAKDFKVTQSAISLAIKSLEEKIGEQLFDRVGKKLILNERGRYFKKIVEPHLIALKDAQNIFTKNKMGGELKIIASKTISGYILADPIYQFLVEYPQIKIEKKTANSEQIIKELHDAKTDIGFIENEVQDIELNCIKIAKDELIIVTSDEELAKKEHFIDTLLNKRWIMREKGSGTRDFFLTKLGKLSSKLNIFLEFSEFEEIKSVLYHKENLTCISRHAVKKELEEGKLFEVKLKNLSFERNLYMVYHKNKTKTKLFEEFMEFIKKSVGNQKE